MATVATSIYAISREAPARQRDVRSAFATCGSAWPLPRPRSAHSTPSMYHDGAIFVKLLKLCAWGQRRHNLNTLGYLLAFASAIFTPRVCHARQRVAPPLPAQRPLNPLHLGKLS